MTVFDGALYVGTSNDTIGGQLWRSQNGTNVDTGTRARHGRQPQ